MRMDDYAVYTGFKSADPAPIFKPGRKCRYKGCTKILSRYNPRKVCFAHAMIYLEDEFDRNKGASLLRMKALREKNKLYRMEQKEK